MDIVEIIVTYHSLHIYLDKLGIRVHVRPNMLGWDSKREVKNTESVFLPEVDG